MSCFSKLPVFLVLLTSSILLAKAEPKIENWYTHWATGLGYSHFSGDFSKINYTGNYRGSIGLDLVGFYATLNKHSALGIISNQNIINMKDENNPDDKMKILQYQTSISFLYFFDQIPHYYYLRSDLGITHGVVDITDLDLNRQESGEGVGILIAGGHGFPIGDETNSVSLALTYSLHYNRIPSKNNNKKLDFFSNNLYLMVGGFW